MFRTIIQTAEDLYVVDDSGNFGSSEKTTENILAELAQRTGGGTFDCPSGVSVGDWVYKTTTAGEVDKADATNIKPVIGIVTYKPTSTTCIVQAGGTIGGFSGLTTGKRYFAKKGVPGDMTDDPSSIITSSGMVQKIAVAISATELKVDIKQLIEVES